MRKTLVAALILACMTSGCISTNTRGPNSGREAALNIDPGRSQSCYGGPVYVPC